MNIKHWVYKHYWWIFLVVIFLAALYAYYKNIDLKTAMPFLIAMLSIFYFLQKQQLEETKLFREIFSESNKRYDSLNEKLEEIFSENNKESLSNEEKVILVDYFNLCGEEYIYYKQGYIFPSVWRSWHSGMSWYMRDNRIKGFWKEEKKTNSYYGLKM